MATTTTFSNMLNEYVNEKLLMSMLKERNYFFSMLDHSKDWQGANYVLPWLAAVGSSVKWGGLSASNDIAEETTLRGEISMKEAYGTMKFNSTDLLRNGKVSEQNFLKILPDQLERHMKFMSDLISTSILGGGFVAKATANGTAGGEITVNDPERFQIGMKVSVDDDNSNAVSGYVTAIDQNTGVLTIKDERSAGVAVNLSDYTTAQNAKIYSDGMQSDGFDSLEGILLSASNGGGATYGGETKASYPILQAINVLGSDITATNILQKIFDAYVTIRKRGGGAPFKVLMSYRNFGSCLKSLESSKGAFNVSPGKKAASVFGWTSISVAGFAGELELVAVQEKNDDTIVFIDPSSMKFASCGGIQRMKSPDGNEYFVERATSGYTYLVDHQLHGNLVVKIPQHNGIIHSISYS